MPKCVLADEWAMSGSHFPNRCIYIFIDINNLIQRIYRSWVPRFGISGAAFMQGYKTQLLKCGQVRTLDHPGANYRILFLTSRPSNLNRT